MNSWLSITSLGDSNLTLPAALAITIWLGYTRAWRLAAGWSMLFGFGLALVLVTKIAFVGWGIGIRALDFTGISGHAMRAAAILPVMALLMTKNLGPQARAAGLAAGWGLAVLVGLSRYVVHAHSFSEALAGCLLGVLVAMGFMRLCREQPTPAVPGWLLAFGLLALLPSSQAKPAPTTQWVNGVALYLAGHDRPYDRELWLAAGKPRRPPPAAHRM